MCWWRLLVVALLVGLVEGRRLRGAKKLQLQCHADGRAPAGPLNAIATGSDSPMPKPLHLPVPRESKLRLEPVFPGDVGLPLPATHALKLQSSVRVDKPAYVHAFDDDLWLTQFGLRRPGNVIRVRDNQAVASLRSRGQDVLTWPNSLTKVPAGTFPWAEGEGVLVCDGFLWPGASDGGVYLLSDMDADAVQLQRLTGRGEGWFYHKAVLVGAARDGNLSVLCARGRKPLFGAGEGELVLLERPLGWAARGELAGPWEETVLAKGPDVMFDVIDLDPTDEQLEVFAAEFFSKRLSKHVLHLDEEGKVRLHSSEVIDDKCGPAYGVHIACMAHEGRADAPPRATPSPFRCIGADLDRRATHILMTSHETIHDGVLATQSLASHVIRGNFLKHVGHAQQLGLRFVKALAGRGCRAPVVGSGQKAPGGALYSYGLHAVGEANIARRKVLASGFRVRGISINPGAPGFVYSFYPRRRDDPNHGGENPAEIRPHLLLAGDCAQAAYVLMPREGGGPDCYDVLDVIEVDGAVGSLAVCYGDKLERSLRSFEKIPILHKLPTREDDAAGVENSEDDWARVVVPNYDKGEIYVFRMSQS